MNEISRKQIDAAALAVLQRALEKYSKRKNITYEDALLAFSLSKTYKELFHFDSLLWTQGPDYLISIYEAELENRCSRAVDVPATPYPHSAT